MSFVNFCPRAPDCGGLSFLLVSSVLWSIHYLTVPCVAFISKSTNGIPVRSCALFLCTLARTATVTFIARSVLAHSVDDDVCCCVWLPSTTWQSPRVCSVLGFSMMWYATVMREFTGGSKFQEIPPIFPGALRTALCGREPVKGHGDGGSCFPLSFWAIPQGVVGIELRDLGWSWGYVTLEKWCSLSSLRFILV